MKAKILSIGTFNEAGKPVGWVFDCGNEAAAFELTTADDGMLLGGYTIPELRAIAAEYVRQ